MLEGEGRAYPSEIDQRREIHPLSFFWHFIVYYVVEISSFPLLRVQRKQSGEKLTSTGHLLPCFFAFGNDLFFIIRNRCRQSTACLKRCNAGLYCVLELE